ncbi:hypothetical protein IVB56_27220 [Bradyrhizobium sp. CW7]|uniref:hypothetical protein n=1 Tax=Bradyrhizobium sp. CW7 TaxID=2782688 RepID=UPI001FF900A6|nr:hypothetical protein [Bradyrhizobium sp. CW7]MCK1354640.1 hypothetical protein [Bradyrhizobium sp. CW7]
MTKRMTETEIRIRIVPTHLRWPSADTNSVWRRLHECVHKMHDLARAVDVNCSCIEEKRTLGPNEIERRRTEVVQEARTKLANFGPLDVARRAVAAELNSMQSRSDLTLQDAQTKEKLTKVLKELEAGVAATERLLLERCELRDARRLQYY